MAKRALDRYMNDYARDETRPFSLFPINEIDYLIFSRLVYFNWTYFLPSFFDSLRVKDLNGLGKERAFLNRITYRKEDKELFEAIKNSPRYQEVGIRHFKSIFDNSKNEQFATISFTIPSLEVVCFRGTDTSLVGWKEDLALSSFSPVPSQKDALAYLSQCLHLSDDEFAVVGHSKGGNLAVFSYLSLDPALKNRVREVYSFDGPGFRDTGKAAEAKKDKKIKLYLPTESIVGELFSSPDGKSKIVSKGHLFEQHWTYNWLLAPDGKSLMRAETMYPPLANVLVVFNTWMSGENEERISILCEVFYALFNDPSFISMKDITSHKLSALAKLFLSFKGLTGEDKKKLSPIIFDILKIVKGINDKKKEEKAQIAKRP